jgi:ArsR family transcriptional regulator, arsenate/arsenite/antimonite-responsive transcriptional repressor
MVVKSKRVEYNKDDIELARFTRALSHPARIAILNHLNRVGSCIGKDLVELLPLAQATVSQHLRELIDSGIVKAKQTPPSIVYYIDKENWETARQMISDLMEMGSKKPGK